MSKVIHIHSKQEQAMLMNVLNSQDISFVIKFSMDNCPPCRAAEPKYEQLAKQMSARFFSVHNPFDLEPLWSFLLKNKVMKKDTGYPYFYYRAQENPHCTHSVEKLKTFMADQ